MIIDTCFLLELNKVKTKYTYEWDILVLFLKKKNINLVKKKL